ncbi:hypothetical protein [Streptomyces sp. CT34]|uniref:hypothetical protein n=1 Tax=Streptomyces sp. CT34 TaxID=1553907 RepID=UPI0012FF1294|nr:hypothetical protein [Streptomyces sp. CT34]
MIRRRSSGEAARAEAAVARHEDEVPAVPVTPVVWPAPRPTAVTPAPEPEPADVNVDQDLVLEDLTREQVLDWRNRASADHQLVFDHIGRYGEHSAQRLFTRCRLEVDSEPRRGHHVLDENVGDVGPVGRCSGVRGRRDHSLAAGTHRFAGKVFRDFSRSTGAALHNAAAHRAGQFSTPGSTFPAW